MFSNLNPERPFVGRGGHGDGALLPVRGCCERRRRGSAGTTAAAPRIAAAPAAAAAAASGQAAARQRSAVSRPGSKLAAQRLRLVIK